MSRDGEPNVRAGLTFGISAFVLWGFFPAFFRLLDPVPAHEVLIHRVLWAMPFLALILWWSGALKGLGTVLKDRRTVLTLMVTSVLISINWLIFVWAVHAEKILQVSLGYYINPLVNVALGMVILGERLRKVQMIAVGLATLGVINQAFAVGEVPLAALALAVTFGGYGLLRKQVKADGRTGLFLETLILFPVFALWLVWLSASGQSHFTSEGPGMTALQVLAGPVTVIPLWLFTLGARRLNLSTVGILQFIAPTLHFATALWFGETFSWQQAITFVLIWTGLAVFASSAVIHERRRARMAL